MPGNEGECTRMKKGRSVLTLRGQGTPDLRQSTLIRHPTIRIEGTLIFANQHESGRHPLESISADQCSPVPLSSSAFLPSFPCIRVHFRPLSSASLRDLCCRFFPHAAADSRNRGGRDRFIGVHLRASAFIRGLFPCFVQPDPTNPADRRLAPNRSRAGQPRAYSAFPLPPSALSENHWMT